MGIDEEKNRISYVEEKTQILEGILCLGELCLKDYQ